MRTVLSSHRSSAALANSIVDLAKIRLYDGLLDTKIEAWTMSQQ